MKGWSCSRKHRVPAGGRQSSVGPPGGLLLRRAQARIHLPPATARALIRRKSGSPTKAFHTLGRAESYRGHLENSLSRQNVGYPANLTVTAGGACREKLEEPLVLGETSR